MPDADEGTSTYAPPAQSFKAQYFHPSLCKKTLAVQKATHLFIAWFPSFAIILVEVYQRATGTNTFQSHQLASARDAPTRFGPGCWEDHFCSAGMLGGWDPT